jgi:hypothetical protein
LVHNHAKAKTTFLAENFLQTVILLDTLLTCSIGAPKGRKSTVILYEMPNTIEFRNCNGSGNPDGLVTPAEGFAPPARDPAYNIRIDYSSRRWERWGRPLLPATLMPFLTPD